MSDVPTPRSLLECLWSIPDDARVEAGGENWAASYPVGLYCVQATEEIVTLRAEIARLREALTPSAETKGAYIGEFKQSRTFIDDTGNDCTETVVIEWTAVKEIMAAIMARAALGQRP